MFLPLIKFEILFSALDKNFKEYVSAPDGKCSHGGHMRADAKTIYSSVISALLFAIPQGQKYF